MGLILKELEIAADRGKTSAKTLFDTGASISLIRKNVAEKVATVLRMPHSIDLIMGDGKSTLHAEWLTFIQFSLKGSIFPPQRVVVVDELEEDLIIGTDILQTWKIKLDLEHEDFIIDKSILRLRLV